MSKREPGRERPSSTEVKYRERPSMALRLARQQVEDWNKRHPVGAHVMWKGQETRTTGPAFVIGDGHDVAGVGLDACTDGVVALDSLDVVMSQVADTAPDDLQVVEVVEGTDPVTEDGMPARVTLRRTIALEDTLPSEVVVDRVYCQLTDAETDALTLLWRLVYPSHKERLALEVPDPDEWEYPGQVYRHVKALVTELRDKVIRYDLDKAGIERRDDEACELVKLRWHNGEVVISFGKHRGKSLQQLARRHRGYIEWLLGANVIREARDVLTDALRGRFPTRENRA